MSLPDWPTRPQLTPINAASQSEEGFWFTRMPRIVRVLARAVRDSDVMQVYSVLTERANKYGVCWPSHASIADDAGISERKVRTVLGILSGSGVITVERGRHNNLYTIVAASDLPSDEDVAAFAINRANQSHPAQNAPSGGTKRQSVSEGQAAGIDTSPGTKRQVTRQELHGQAAENDPLTKNTRTKRPRTESKRSPDGDTGSESKPTREPTRTYQVAEWYAKRVGGVIPGKGAREWADAKRLAETGIADDELPALFDWLAAQTWVKSLSLGLMASKYNDWRSSAVIANTEKDLPYNHHKSGKLVF